MTTAPHRRTKALVATALGALLAVGLWRTFGREDRHEEIDAAPADASLPSLADVPTDGPPVPLAEEDVMRFLREERIGWDPVGGPTPVANHRSQFPFAEHPQGFVRLSTNNLGLRNVAPTRVERDGRRRVLVLGDSHTYGVCATEESLGEALDRRLEESTGSKDDWEVLNAGCAYTAPRHQLWRLRRLAALAPDEVIVVTFLGNDLWEQLYLELVEAGEPLWIDEPEYVRRVEALTEAHRGAVFQGLNQVARFLERPAEAERALESMLASYERIAATCEGLGATLTIVLLPTRFAVDEDEEAFASIQELGGFTREELTNNERLGRELLARGRDRGLSVLDATEFLAARDRSQYWRADWHLSVEGIRSLAEFLVTSRD